MTVRSKVWLSVADSALPQVRQVRKGCSARNLSQDLAKVHHSGLHMAEEVTDCIEATFWSWIEFKVQKEIKSDAVKRLLLHNEE